MMSVKAGERQDLRNIKSVVQVKVETRAEPAHLPVRYVNLPSFDVVHQGGEPIEIVLAYRPAEEGV